MMRNLVGSPPTIGIVAHIDPRTYPVANMSGGNVRAAQLPTVMRRLDQIATLVRSIKLWDGSDLRIIVASTPVGGPREAAIVQAQFEREGVDSVIHSMCTWSMGYETQFFGHPEWLELLEAMNGTAWPGAVLLNSLRASATAHMRPVWCSYPPDVEGLPRGSMALHPVTVENITRFVRCAAARAMMRGKSYASMGHVSMGIAGSEGMSDIYARYFGMKFVHVDQLEIAKRLEKELYDPLEAKHAVRWFVQMFGGRIDPDGKNVPEENLQLIRDYLVPMTLIVRGIMRGDDWITDEERGHGCNALLGGTAGQRYWTDWYPNFDFVEAWLTSMFDWNGHRPPIICATENDGLNGMGMLWGTMLTGLSTLFADLRTYWSVKAVRELAGVDISDVAPSGFLHLINSGPAALEWAGDPTEQDKGNRTAAAVDGTIWYPAEKGYFPKGGLSTHFRTPGGVPVTMLRFNRVGLDLTLTVVHGHTVELPRKAADAVSEVTNPTWPDTFVVPDGNTSPLEYMAKFNDPNHVVCAPGHIGADVLLLASMLRIPVDYTNCGEPWHPTLWHRLGGDRAACARLGPLYR